MTDRAAFFEAVLRRVYARMRLRPPYPLGAREVDDWLARRDPALLAEAERETQRWIGVLNRLSELAEALIAADLRRLSHACTAWAYALDPTLTEDASAQAQVRANLALSGLWHPTRAADLREENLDRFLDRLRLELAIAQRAGADLRRVLPVLRRLVELMGGSASSVRLPKVEHAEVLVALAPLVWAYNLPRIELIGPVTAFRLRLMGLPDAEIAPWLPASGGPWWWVWTTNLPALTSWLHRKTEHFRPLAPEAEAALDQLDSMVGPLDADAEGADRALTRALVEALGELHRVLHVEGLVREEALVAGYLAALQDEPADAEAHARRAGLLPGPDTAWLRAHHLPEMLTRIGLARFRQGPAKALRGVEQVAGWSAPR